MSEPSCDLFVELARLTASVGLAANAADTLRTAMLEEADPAQPQRELVKDLRRVARFATDFAVALEEDKIGIAIQEEEERTPETPEELEANPS